MLPSQQREPLRPLSRRPLWSCRRNYNQDSYGYYTPESFWARNKSTIVVGGAIGLCCGTYFCQWTAERLAEQGDHALSDLIQQNLISSATNIREGRWWVMLTSSFAHANLVHLGINMYCLWGFGSSLVHGLGVPRFTGLWAVSAVACSAAEIYWQNTQERLQRETAGRRWDRPEEFSVLGIPISRERAVAIAGGSSSLEPHYGGSIGASGVLCGLAGTLVCLAPRMQVSVFFLPAPLWSAELLLVAGSVYCMATGSLQLFGHAGHLGGLTAGVAYYYGVARPWLRRAGRL